MDEPDGQDPNHSTTTGLSEDGYLRESAKNNNQQARTKVTKRSLSLPKRGSRADSSLQGPARLKD
ncbi:hypothetical protein F4818DRAFT_419086 [Hypoxylon cercidicola]|nr:hypothetical protein F4818DRAFT_419086 [Hypoxylon cercidicola]